MCGIAGIYLRDPSFRVDLEALFDTLAVAIEPRGDDATGYVALAEDGAGEWQKAACAASTFSLYRRGLPKGTRAALIHTRFATQGLPAFMENNHPIKRGSFYIVHNGHVHNDDDMFVKSERNRFGQVDSEAIAARLSSLGELSLLSDVMAEIEGDAAVAALDERDPTRLVVARGSYSPLWVYDGRRIVLFASTKEAIEKAHKRHIGKMSRNRLEQLESGEQWEFTADGLTQKTMFKPWERPVKKTTYASSSGYQGSYAGAGYGGYHYGGGSRRPADRQGALGWEWDDDDTLTVGGTTYVADSSGELTSIADYVAGQQDKKNYACESCELPLDWNEVTDRWDSEKKVSYQFCDECAKLWDWDQLGGTFVPQDMRDQGEAEAEVVGADEIVSEDYANVNASILDRTLRFFGV